MNTVWDVKMAAGYPAGRELMDQGWEPFAVIHAPFQTNRLVQPQLGLQIWFRKQVDPREVTVPVPLEPEKELLDPDPREEVE